ncbi:hypothetical protein ACLK1S_11335 [Escherichia coli]
MIGDQVNLAQRFHATYSGYEWQAFLQLNQATARHLALFYALNRVQFSAFRQSGLSFVIIVSPDPPD